MRSYLLTQSLALLISLAACKIDPDPPDAGTENHPCRTGILSSACDEGLTCNDGTCVGCDSYGDDCCSVPGGSKYCGDGLACVGLYADEQYCQDDCGLPGLPCCPGGIHNYYCPGSGGECDLDTLLCPGEPAGGPGDECQAGAYAYSVWVLGETCFGREVVFHVNSADEAETCRKQLVDEAAPTEEICAVGQIPDPTEVCRDGGILLEPITVPNCSDDKLEKCMALNCVAPDCTWTKSDCAPPPP
jgi:hypothetical protein